jgi:hypothetical protein
MNISLKNKYLNNQIRFLRKVFAYKRISHKQREQNYRKLAI